MVDLQSILNMKARFLLICMLFIGIARLCAGPSFAYILQADKFAKDKKECISKINSSGRDVVILDYSFNGSKDGMWLPQELAAMKQGSPQRKIIAYISIGEAENYRPYWNKEWLKAKPPAFLLDENPKWKGNYRVRYWNKRWQAIVFNYLDTIIRQGFDGVYLDIVDGYEYFEKGKDNCINPDTSRTYRVDMKRFVAGIIKHVKGSSPRFLVFQQNALALLSDSKYLELLDGIGAEDIFTDGSKMHMDRDAKDNLNYLKKVQGRGLPIMVVDYAKHPYIQSLVRENAARNSLDVLFTNKELSKIGTFVTSDDAKNEKPKKQAASSR